TTSSSISVKAMRRPSSLGRAGAFIEHPFIRDSGMLSGSTYRYILSNIMHRKNGVSAFSNLAPLRSQKASQPFPGTLDDPQTVPLHFPIHPQTLAPGLCDSRPPAASSPAGGHNECFLEATIHRLNQQPCPHVGHPHAPGGLRNRSGPLHE